MLAKALKEMRATKIVPQAQALSSLGGGWQQAEQGAITKDFMFDDFVQASNFMQRYADFCHQVNHGPEWSNVYNRVTVRLHNQEFNGVTRKEVQIGKYLDTVSAATLNQDVDEVLRLEDVTRIAGIEVRSLLNDQSQRTSIFAVDESKQARSQLYLTQ